MKKKVQGHYTDVNGCIMKQLSARNVEFQMGYDVYCLPVLDAVDLALYIHTFLRKIFYQLHLYFTHLLQLSGNFYATVKDKNVRLQTALIS
jgi:hypothetical protein